jgi:hypothetical protein
MPLTKITGGEFDSNQGGLSVAGIITATTFNGGSVTATSGDFSGKINSTYDSNDFMQYNGSGTSPFFRFNTSGTANGYIQHTNTVGGESFFWNDRANRGLKINGSTPQWYDGAYQTMWHSNNDGSGSGLDADLLDGLNSTSFLRNDGTIRFFDFSSLGSNATQARRFEIARIGIDYNDWNTVGVFEVTVMEKYFAQGLKKRYIVYYGYVSTYGVQLAEYQGSGSNSFRVTTSGEVVISGDNRYISVYVDVDYYSLVDVRVMTNRQITTNSNPEAGYTYIFSSPTVTNIAGFSADSTTYSPGSASFGGTVTQGSDVKLKKNIKTIDNALEKTLRLRGVEFDRLDLNDSHQIGVIAQEVEEIIPELVSDEGNNGIKSVAYGNISALLIEAIKEQNETINTLRHEIDNLKKQIEG